MKPGIITLIFLCLIVAGNLFSQPGKNLPIITTLGKGKVNTKIDNMGYWKRMVRLGYVKPSPSAPTPRADSISTIISAPGISTQNSPDIPVTNRSDVTQSENSLFIDPENEEIVLNSNNSSSWILGYADTPFGADALYSNNYGETWGGSTEGVPNNNNGDPASAIGRNGWWYVNKIRGDYGMGVAYSKDEGKTWKEVKIASVPLNVFGLLDKNHLWIDNTPSSPFEGNMYCSWTNFVDDDPDTNQIEISRSLDQGLTWSSPFTISTNVQAQELNHGVNIQTGPNGEVYVIWSVYDSWPADETAIGFSKSIDGGGIFTPATRIIGNLKGLRMSGTGKNMRVSAFPCMAVDNSPGPYHGTIYIVFPNIGYPGINTGSDIDIYLIKSTDQGETWSNPTRVNQDPPGLGKQHYFPWITCDPITGGLCVIYYDDRNIPSTKAETYVSYSYDRGASWTDTRVSDFSFTPMPISGLAYNYFGDYIGIQSNNMKVYPIWTDNHARDGRAMTYVSPFDLGPAPGQPWVMYHSNALSSITSGNPQNLNYGDSLHLTLSLRNIGDLPASEVTATVTCRSAYITMTDSTESYGNIDASEVKTVPDGYAFKVSDTIPDNLRIRFDVKTSSADSVWFSHFSLTSHAPGLRIVKMVILDTLSGNRNGWLDPGEAVRIRVSVTNSGDFPCPEVFGLLSADSLYLTLQQDSVFLDTIKTPQVKYAFYPLTVSQDAPVGTGVDLVYDLFSGKYHTRKVFHQVIGQVSEDWETNTFTKFNWQQGGILPWIITSQNPYQGIYCAQSGHIYDNQNSAIYLSYTSAADDSISFYYKTSTELDYDYLYFYIDNILQDQWSGEVPWTRASFPVAAGTHTFRWMYQKDLALESGQDRVWLDFIAFPPPILPSVNSGPDDTICSGNLFQLQATAATYDSLRWTTSGDGLFSNDTTTLPLYTPGSNDIISGNVHLKLTAWNQYGSFSDRMRLSLAAIPVATISVTPNDTVCATQSIALSADTTRNSDYLWIPGNLSGPMVSIDTSGYGIGTFKMKLTVKNISQCSNTDSVYLTFRDCTGMEEASQQFQFRLYPNPSNGQIALSFQSRKPETITLTISDAGGNIVYSVRDILVNRSLSYPIDLRDKPSGVYLVWIHVNNQTLYRKLVINSP